MELLRADAIPQWYNAVNILEANLPQRAEQIALYSEAGELSFGAVAREVNRVGHALLHSGVRFGDCVGILAPDSAEWVTTFFGSIKIGAVALGLNTQLKPAEYAHILRDSRARVLVVHASLLELIAPLRDQLTMLQQVIVIGAAQPGADWTFADWLAAQPTELDAAATHRDDFCSLHYSSGTTGQPKGMFHAHKDYPLIAQNSGVNLFGLTAADRTFSAAKLFFVYGLGGNLIMPWAVGASTVLYAGSSRSAGGMLELMARFRPTVCFSVPVAYLTMLTLGEIATRYDLASLRLCLSAGEVLPAPIWAAWKAATGLEILDTVGCSESLHTFLANRPHDLRPGSSGKPSPGYAARVVDAAGNPVPPGVLGHLLVKGETMALFYLHQSELSRQTFRGEWLFTGDMYTVDSDGFYWHAGRSDDLFKVGGIWVAPTAVESVLMSHPAVVECAVVGDTDQHGLVKPRALIRLAEGLMLTNDLLRQLLQHCAARLSPHECPRWLDVVTELPRTATGKVQRYKLRADATAQKAAR